MLNLSRKQMNLLFIKSLILLKLNLEDVNLKNFKEKTNNLLCIYGYNIEDYIKQITKSKFNAPL